MHSVKVNRCSEMAEEPEQTWKPRKSQEEQEPVAFLLGWFWVQWLHLQHHRRRFNKNQKCLWIQCIDTASTASGTSSWSWDSPGPWKEDSTFQCRGLGSNPGLGVKILHASRFGKKQTTKKTGSRSNPVIKYRRP